MPKKKSSGRDISSFKSNVTASLQLIHKNAGVNDHNLLYEAASFAAHATYENALVPAASYMKHTFFSSKTKTPSHKSSKISKEDLLKSRKQRQIETEAASLKIRAETKAIQKKIAKLYQAKKTIDNAEKKLKANNKGAKTKISLPEKHTKARLTLLEKIDNLLVKKLALMSPLITEHAARRVDIMFLLMIAIYKKNLIISKGKTERQHGQGSRNLGTAACHVSLIPHPVFHKRETNIVSSSIKEFLSNYSTSIFGSKSGSSKKDSMPHPITEVEIDFLKGSYLQDVLNMTTELPTIVNQFDQHMEGKWKGSNAVNGTIKILNQVSSGELDPIQGISQFGTVMSMFFAHIQYRYVLPKIKYSSSSLVLFPKAFAKVWESQQRGTLSMFNIKTQAIKDGSKATHTQASINSKYIYLMLNLHKLSTSERLSRFVFSGPIQTRIQEMQEEILMTQSKFVKRKKKQPKTSKPETSTSHMFSFS